MEKMFITFEGPEGSGKTSVLKSVEKRLRDRGVDVMTTREPGGIKISELIRDIILDVHHSEMDARTEALLYAASRRQHLVEKIIPALETGKVVLCDRFVDSSLAYQGYGRELGFQTVFDLNKFAIDACLPDLTIFVDVPPSVGLGRVFDNHRRVDRLDLEDMAFHKRVYQGYQELIAKWPDRIKTVDGTKSLDEVVKATMELIDRLKKG